MCIFGRVGFGLGGFGAVWKRRLLIRLEVRGLVT